MLLIGNFISNVRGDYSPNSFMAKSPDADREAPGLSPSGSDRYSSAFIPCLQYEAA